MKIGIRWMRALALAALALAAPPARADYLVTFESGGKLRIDSYRTERGWFLIPTSGGEIGVPEKEISSVVPMEQIDGTAPLAKVGDSGAVAESKAGPRVMPSRDVSAPSSGAAGGQDNPLRSLIDQLRSGRSNPEEGGPAPEGRGNMGDIIQQRVERLREMSSRATDPAMRERFERMIENLERQSGGVSPAGPVMPAPDRPGGRRGADRQQ